MLLLRVAFRVVAEPLSPGRLMSWDHLPQGALLSSSRARAHCSIVSAHVCLERSKSHFNHTWSHDNRQRFDRFLPATESGPLFRPKAPTRVGLDRRCPCPQKDRKKQSMENISRETRRKCNFYKVRATYQRTAAAWRTEFGPAGQPSSGV